MADFRIGVNRKFLKFLPLILENEKVIILAILDSYLAKERVLAVNIRRHP